MCFYNIFLPNLAILLHERMMSLRLVLSPPRYTILSHGRTAWGSAWPEFIGFQVSWHVWQVLLDILWGHFKSWCLARRVQVKAAEVKVVSWGKKLYWFTGLLAVVTMVYVHCLIHMFYVSKTRRRSPFGPVLSEYSELKWSDDIRRFSGINSGHAGSKSEQYN